MNKDIEGIFIDTELNGVRIHLGIIYRMQMQMSETFVII